MLPSPENSASTAPPDHPDGLHPLCDVNLQDHVRTKHTETVKFTCYYCDYSFESRRAIKNHISTNHTLKFFYPTENPTYRRSRILNSSASMRKHFKTHFRHENLKCPVCNDIFQSPQVMAAHIEEHHSSHSNVCAATITTVSKGT